MSWTKIKILEQTGLQVCIPTKQGLNSMMHLISVKRIHNGVSMRSLIFRISNQLRLLWDHFLCLFLCIFEIVVEFPLFGLVDKIRGLLHHFLKLFLAALHLNLNVISVAVFRRL